MPPKKPRLSSAHRKRPGVTSPSALGNIMDYSLAGQKTLPQQHSIGSMSYKCMACGALMFKGEVHKGQLDKSAKFSLCCAQGKVALNCYSDPPAELQELFLDSTVVGNQFRKNIRSYNSALAFTSMGVNQDSLTKNQRGPYTFRISGAVHHYIGTIQPDDPTQPKCAQIYIYDNEENELQHRLQAMPNLQVDTDVMTTLQRMLHRVNPFVQIFRQAAMEMTSSTDEMKLVLHCNPETDRRRYNLPTASELAVIIPATNPTPSNRDIVIHKRATDNPNERGLSHISEIHPQYDPLQYVLLFPTGQLGWFIHMTTLDGKKVTIMNFYAYHLMQRQDQFNVILRSGRLLHQYMVNQYAKMEQQRLNFCFHNQTALRSELYQGLADAINAGDTDGATVGKKIVLPATFVGGPRYMHQMYQDAMAIVRRFGKPDHFVTMTCNSQWPEIVESLLPGQSPSDRPDVIARVFQQKNQALLEDITKIGIFGKVVAYIQVIEFQKRGLPHSHSLYILNNDDKPRQPDDYDKFVTAELPAEELTELRQIVVRNMIHGPCGKLNMQSPCMKDGKCTKDFPKPYQELTTHNSHGYPSYKRANNGDFVEKNGIPIDNRWVVPYNPYLTKKYNAHINVEICSTVASVKYLYKYVYKGPDRIIATVEVSSPCGDAATSTAETPVTNEIQKYIDGRYVSAVESGWRLFSFDLYRRMPGIQRLALHLPRQQPVTYTEGDAVNALERTSKTTLTAWFEANKNYPEARRIYYHDFPEKFTWNPIQRTWKPRKSGSTVGRLYTANPLEGERYYLRVLLHHTPGCQSFDDLLMLDDGTKASSYKEAAVKRGFLEDDSEWFALFEEAIVSAFPSQLRKLFVTLLLFCEPAEPAAIFERFWNHMAEDFKKHSDHTFYDHVSVARNNLLIALDEMLRTNGRSLNDFSDLPQIDPSLSPPEPPRHSTITDYFDPEEKRLKADNNSLLLNDDQRKAYDDVVSAVHSNRSALLFIDGPGGCGKTFLYNTILQRLRSLGYTAIAVASSGIAAELLDGGTFGRREDGALPIQNSNPYSRE